MLDAFSGAGEGTLRPPQINLDSLSCDESSPAGENLPNLSARRARLPKPAKVMRVTVGKTTLSATKQVLKKTCLPFTAESRVSLAACAFILTACVTMTRAAIPPRPPPIGTSSTREASPNSGRAVGSVNGTPEPADTLYSKHSASS